MIFFIFPFFKYFIFSKKLKFQKYQIVKNEDIFQDIIGHSFVYNNFLSLWIVYFIIIIIEKLQLRTNFVKLLRELFFKIVNRNIIFRRISFWSCIMLLFYSFFGNLINKIRVGKKIFWIIVNIRFQSPKPPIRAELSMTWY